MKLFKKAKKGFTLVELVVVIAVIAILAAVSVGAYFGVTESAKNSQAQQEGKAIHTNIVLVGNDPAQSDIAVFTKDGLEVKDQTKLTKAIADSMGVSVDTYDVYYTSTSASPAVAVPSSFTKTTIVFADWNDSTIIASADAKYTHVAYYLASGHHAIFNITTGAQE